MQIQFLDSKDGSKTFSANGMLYHSSYSPQKEAQRFIDTNTFQTTPEIIFIIEGGLNYFSNALKSKYKDCLVVCIRFFDNTFPDENSWDKVINLKDFKNLSQFLINSFGEEALLCSAVLEWPVAQKFFAEQIQFFYKEYKTALEYCKTLLVTRQFFEKKWLLNSCNFIIYAEQFLNPDIKIEVPVVICASGPGLKSNLQSIKSFRKKIFVLCLSSALSVLIKNSIIPDLILSTDGGFWAGEHLKYLKRNPGIPVAAPCEAFLSKTILRKNPILALNYNDESSFIGSQILQQTGIPFFNALRNPTVSGTGLFLAKNITNNNIYFCGLDLSSATGFQHSQPNELEKNNELNDCRIKTKETRISRSRYNSESLNIYRDWFSCLDQNQTKKIFRVTDGIKTDKLGNITNLTPNDFYNKLQNLQESSLIFNFSKASSINYDKHKVITYIIEQLKTEKWSHQIFPADYISINNCTNNSDKESMQKRLETKIEQLISKIRKIADE